jgi:hypothetical protein
MKKILIRHYVTGLIPCLLTVEYRYKYIPLTFIRCMVITPKFTSQQLKHNLKHLLL